MMENKHIFFVSCQVDKRKMGDYDVNYHPSAIDNFTPLHSPFLVMHGSSSISSSREPIRSDVVGGGAFYCLYPQ